jgi:DNA-binding NtrC family response regulator
MRERVLIIDDDAGMLEDLRQRLNPAGVLVEAAGDGYSAIEKLRDEKYNAVVLDPMIRHRLNGFAVLNFIELEQPEIIDHLFLLTGMTEQTIARTAPSVRDRLFRKPADASRIADAILATMHRKKSNRRMINILIVEDDEQTAQAMRSIVETLGYDVVLARGGREALECLATGDYAAIMLDLVLPDLDGFAVLDQLRREMPGVLSHLIVTTGMPERYVGGLDVSQICAVMQKPIDPGVLSRCLAHCAEQQ